MFRWKLLVSQVLVGKYVHFKALYADLKKYEQSGAVLEVYRYNKVRWELVDGWKVE